MTNHTAAFIKWTEQPCAEGEDPAPWLSDLAFDAAWQAWEAGRKALIADLQDPAVVWASILRGTIARPQALDHYEDCKATLEQLQAWQLNAAKILDDAEGALAVLFTMLVRIDQKVGAAVADEIRSNILAALKSVQHMGQL